MFNQQEKEKGAGAQEARMGYCPFVRPRLLQRKSVTIRLPGRYVATGSVGQAHDRACVRVTGLHGRLGRARDRNSRPRVTTGFLCLDRAGAGTGRLRSQQGVLCRNRALGHPVVTMDSVATR